MPVRDPAFIHGGVEALMSSSTELQTKAQTILLHTVEALVHHRSAFVIVGSQAIQLSTSRHPRFPPLQTFDVDIAIDPRKLSSTPPPLEASVLAARFRRDSQTPGRWWFNGVAVDLIVPQRLGGRREVWATLGPHGNHVACKAVGLEPALLDNSIKRLQSWRGSRAIQIRVAGPTASLIAKLHRMADRRWGGGYYGRKDAVDIYRLLRVVPTGHYAVMFRHLLQQDLTSWATERALEYLSRFFGRTEGFGTELLRKWLSTSQFRSKLNVTECLQLTGSLLNAVKRA